MEKNVSRQVRVQIRNVLLDVWDPIGIANEPNARDEYDGYIGDVFELLANGGTDSEIASHLLRIVHERMELRGAKLSDMQATIYALRQIQLP